jgi:hypothetical protein
MRAYSSLSSPSRPVFRRRSSSDTRRTKSTVWRARIRYRGYVYITSSITVAARQGSSTLLAGMDQIGFVVALGRIVLVVVVAATRT